MNMLISYFHDTSTNRKAFVYTGPSAPPDPAERFDGYDRMEPKRTAIPKGDNRFRSISIFGHQTGTKSKSSLLHYTGSHGWRGRK
jgi:hypothetical protein